MSHSDTVKKILIAVEAILLMASNAFAETSREYLETIDLNDLCIVYPKNHQGFWVASVKDPDGYFHTVTVGSHIGKNYGRIMKITNDTVEVVEVIWRQDKSTGDWVKRPLTLEVACPGIPPSANAPSDDSHIRWLTGGKLGKELGWLGLSVGDCRLWRWVYRGSRGIQPATSEEAKELKEEYGDFSRFLNDPCPTPR